MFKVIEERYERNEIKEARSIKIYRAKSSKIKCDIDSLLTCKRNSLIPTFSPMTSALTQQDITMYRRNL